MVVGDAEELTVPLAGDLISGVAIAPRVVIHGFFRVNLHVLLAGAAAVQGRDGAHDFLVLGGYLQRP